MTEFITGISNFVKGVTPFFVMLGKFIAAAPELTLGLIAFAKSGLADVMWWSARMFMLSRTITGSMTTGGQIAAGQITAAMAGKGVTGGGMNAAQTLAQGKASAEMTKAGGMAAKDAGMGSFMKSLGTATTILALGAALMMVAKAVDIFADAMIKMKGVGLAEVAAGLGFIMVGLWALNSAAVGLTATGAPLVLLALGAAMLAIGGAVYLAASGLAILVDSFTNMFAVIGPNGDSVLKAGVGFLALAAGIGVLTLSLIAMGAASILALPGLLILGATTAMLVSTAETLNAVGGSNGLKESINAINSVDTEKLEALKSLSNWLALLGGTTTVKFDETLEVDGEIVISGSGGGKTNTDWIKDPIFISKLKNAIFDKNASDKNYGKANRA